MKEVSNHSKTQSYKKNLLTTELVK